jgi:hypothetical protein
MRTALTKSELEASSTASLTARDVVNSSKSADIKEIALLACKCISLMTGDEVFYRLQKQKMEDMQ